MHAISMGNGDMEEMTKKLEEEDGRIEVIQLCVNLNVIHQMCNRLEIFHERNWIEISSNSMRELCVQKINKTVGLIETCFVTLQSYW